VRGFSRLCLVADANTYQALGCAVERRLRAARRAVKTVLLSNDEVVADERHLMQLFVALDGTHQVLLAVGSGTIHDIVRFVGDRARTPFIAVPTAPSVDGYPSSGAPVVLDGFKQTIPARSPLAVFADLSTLCAAPRPMIAAGFGDTLAKYTAHADWQLGHLLWGEPYDEAVAARTLGAVAHCARESTRVARADPGGVHLLMMSLLESGLSMAEIGHSRPASGSEHHLSHFWEMLLLRQGRPAVLHGAKTGVASLIIARLYGRLRAMAPGEVRARLAVARLPDSDAEAQRVRAEFGAAGEQVVRDHRAFLAMTSIRFDDLRTRIAENWGRIQQISDSVPDPEVLAEFLREVGAPTDAAELGLTPAECQRALRFSHYLRNRFTILKLARILGLPEVTTEAPATL